MVALRVNARPQTETVYCGGLPITGASVIHDALGWRAVYEEKPLRGTFISRFEAMAAVQALVLAKRQKRLIPDQTLQTALVRATNELGHTPSQREWQQRYNRPRLTSYYYRYETWTRACQAAGLLPRLEATAAHGYKCTWQQWQIEEALARFVREYGLPRTFEAYNVRRSGRTDYPYRQLVLDYLRSQNQTLHQFCAAACAVAGR